MGKYVQNGLYLINNGVLMPANHVEDLLLAQDDPGNLGSNGIDLKN